MIKKSFSFTLIFLLAFVNNALAHTGLEYSSPQNGEVIKYDLKQLTFTFETKVEQNSTFTLLTSSGEDIPIEKITLSNNQMVGTLKNTLHNGNYQVNWRIIGADGHPIEGEFPFTVKLSETETITEEQDETQSQSSSEENKGVDHDTPNETKEDVQQNKLPSYVVPFIIGVLLLVVIGSFLLIIKRKK